MTNHGAQPASESAGSAGTGLVCRLCGNAAGNERIVAREMMFGLGEEFDYVSCASCGSMQLLDVPVDLGRHYPDEYYSLAPSGEGRVAGYLKQLRARALFGHGGVLGRMLLRRFGAPPALRAVRTANVALDEPILDVGCGAGHLLCTLRSVGYRSLTGVDPFLDRDRTPVRGVQLFRRQLEDVTSEFGFIMLHHSIEHVADPIATLAQVHRLLRSGGRALVRTPVADGLAARIYGADWVQLDAPRHLVIQTVRSMRLIAERVGLVMEGVRYDSDALQFWGSEQYRRGIALRDARSVAENPRASVFSPDELHEFHERAARLNASGEGDQACFTLSKS